MKFDLPIFSVLASMLLICAVGCTDPKAKPLVGSWVLEKPDRVMERIGGIEADRAQETASIDDSNSMPKMAITFESNGRFQTVTKIGNMNREKNGAWRVISLDEKARKMSIRCTIGTEETDHSVELVDESTIRLVPPNMAGLTLKMRFVRD